MTNHQHTLLYQGLRDLANLEHLQELAENIVDALDRLDNESKASTQDRVKYLVLALQGVTDHRQCDDMLHVASQFRL